MTVTLRPACGNSCVRLVDSVHRAVGNKKGRKVPAFLAIDRTLTGLTIAPMAPLIVVFGDGRPVHGTRCLLAYAVVRRLRGRRMRFVGARLRVVPIGSIVITSCEGASCGDEKRGRCDADYLHFSSPVLGRATAMHRERYEPRSTASIVREDRLSHTGAEVPAGMWTWTTWNHCPSDIDGHGPPAWRT